VNKGSYILLHLYGKITVNVGNSFCVWSAEVLLFLDADLSINARDAAF
jgi:hypothetical protein